MNATLIVQYKPIEQFRKDLGLEETILLISLRTSLIDGIVAITRQI